MELARQGNAREAQKKFETAVEADANFALAYSRLGQAYRVLRLGERFSSDELPAR